MRQYHLSYQQSHQTISKPIVRFINHFCSIIVMGHLQIYRTISEGIINLADCFFDMAVVEAQQGLDIYKQHTVDNERLGVRTTTGLLVI